MKNLVNQLFKFGIVGGVAFVIDYFILYACTEWLSIYYLVSSFISFSISTIFNYIASVKWVFDVDDSKSKKKNFIVFIIFSILGLLLNQVIMWFGVDILHIYFMIVKIGATAIVMVFNFITRKLFLEGGKTE